MPSSITSLPPELEDMIIQHLSGDKAALRSCALVSRTWSVYSQRALFRTAKVYLYTSKKTAKLLEDLISVPHLQTLVRGLTIRRRRYYEYDTLPLPDHTSYLASVLSLLPNLTKLVFRHGIAADRGPRSYLDLIPDILGNGPLVELDIQLDPIDTFHHVFGILERTNVKRVGFSGRFNPQEVDFGATCKLLHLPLIEHICFSVQGREEEFRKCLVHYCDLPKLKQCTIVAESVDGLIPWRHLLRREFPPLELFKFELGRDFTNVFRHADISEEEVYHPLPLADLPFRHIHLSIHPRALNETRKLIEWWSSTFCALSDSNATIHFTELTFAFTDLPGIETLEGAWNSLDDSLADTTLSGVRSIHFERIDWYTQEKITQAAYPALADKIRLALPRLASRGVLCLT